MTNRVNATLRNSTENNTENSTKDATLDPQSRRETKNRRILAIRGSKGGAGTSMIATNLGIFLAQIGKRVLLVDANVDNGALHSWLGPMELDGCLGQVLYDGVPLEKAVTATSITGLYLLAGSPMGRSGEQQSHLRLDAFWRQLEAVSADFVIIDLPGNFTDFTLGLFCRADYPIIVTLPLPDAVAATYQFVTAAWLYQLESQLATDNAAVFEWISDARCERIKTKSPRKLTLELGAIDESAFMQASELSTAFHPQFIVNQIKIREDDDLGASMVSAAARWLGVNAIVLGGIGWDDNVWLSLRRSRRLLLDFPRSRACKDLEQIVRKVMSLNHTDLFAKVAVPLPTQQQNYYELLEIYPGASEEEVRRAYKQIRSWFGIDGLAVKGAATEAERASFEQMAEEAHARLLDRSERRLYDREHFPTGFTPRADAELSLRDSIAGTVAATQESLPEVVLREGDFVDGTFLARIRKERGVELADISNRAKISVRYLQAIEEERFGDLPAAVFTRGFAMEFARFLKIDPQRAAADFMTKYERAAKRK